MGNGSFAQVFSFWVGILAIILVLALEQYLLDAYGPHRTISATLNRWASDYPVTALGLGVLLGHLLWPLYK